MDLVSFFGKYYEKYRYLYDLEIWGFKVLCIMIGFLGISNIYESKKLYYKVFLIYDDWNKLEGG